MASINHESNKDILMVEANLSSALLQEQMQRLRGSPRLPPDLWYLRRELVGEQLVLAVLRSVGTWTAAVASASAIAVTVSGSRRGGGVGGRGGGGRLMV